MKRVDWSNLIWSAFTLGLALYVFVVMIVTLVRG